jgi:hypothetical protein
MWLFHRNELEIIPQALQNHSCKSEVEKVVNLVVIPSKHQLSTLGTFFK